MQVAGLICEGGREDHCRPPGSRQGRVLDGRSAGGVGPVEVPEESPSDDQDELDQGQRGVNDNGSGESPSSVLPPTGRRKWFSAIG